MQLSFVYITALIAAVSATPLRLDSRAETYSAGVPAGGTGGFGFSDLEMLQSNPNVPTITSFGGQGGNRVDLVYVKGFRGEVGNSYVAIHGGSGGIPTNMVIAPGEYINYMELQVGTVEFTDQIFYVRVKTNLENWGSVGEPLVDSAPIPYSPPPGYTRLVGFAGQSGHSLDQLAPIWA